MAMLQAKSDAGPRTRRKHGSTAAVTSAAREQQRPPADAVAERAEERRREAAQQVLAQEREADGGEVDARLAHEIDAEEGHQAHPRGDGDEVGREDDFDSSI